MSPKLRRYFEEVLHRDQEIYPVFWQPGVVNVGCEKFENEHVFAGGLCVFCGRAQRG